MEIYISFSAPRISQPPGIFCPAIFLWEFSEAFWINESQSLEEKINAGIFELKIDKNVLTQTTLFYEQKNPGFARKGIFGAVPPLPSSCFGRQMLTPLPPKL